MVIGVLAAIDIRFSTGPDIISRYDMYQLDFNLRYG